MNLLHLFASGIFACSDGPDGLISENNVAPVSDERLHCVQLFLNHFDGLIVFPLSESFSEAVDDLKSSFKGDFHLFGQSLIGLAEVGSSFGVTDNDPLDVDVLQLFRSDFTSVGSKAEG